VDPLAPFHPVVARWFATRLGEPTEVQRRAWPAIAHGEHVLATAPTGSGKTLAAFLWALDRLLAGVWGAGAVRVLYVSPLKALNNDVERNLLAPLAELAAAFAAAGVPHAPPRVAVRSGDTPPAERRRMLRRPPEVLITTPESLNLLLGSAAGREALGGLRTVILDEVHAVAGSKRGVHLMTAVDRLVRHAGEVQRIALSATVTPLPRIARFVGGWVREGRSGAVSYRPRPVTVLETGGGKAYQLMVQLPAPLPEGGEQPPDPTPREALAPAAQPRRGPLGGVGGHAIAADFWTPFVAALKERIRRNRTTLVFSNSRRMAEKLTRLLNDGEPEDIAYAHHGSLAREIRLAVERRFKEGRLPALVATSSLELGIDIGDLDEVLMVGSPPTVASTVQRLGRAGHAVGEISRGGLYPLFGRDLLHAAAVGRAALDQQIEPLRPVEGALDVLAQVVLGMTAAEEWDLDELYDELRASDPYHELSRRHFDLVVEMLAGRYADSRIRELTPRIFFDRLARRVRARPGATLLLATAGGTIPDRGYFHLRLQGSLARLGELDEEFVWERGIGDRFVLGAQTWRIQQVTHNDVLVAPAAGDRGAMAPFWRGEDRDGSFHLAGRAGELLAWADAFLAAHPTGSLAAALVERWPLTPAAAQGLATFLGQQRAATGVLPHRRRLLIEHVRDPNARDEKATVILHTLWGGRVNRPLAFALAGAWEERFGTRLELTHDDDAVLVELPHALPVDPAGPAAGGGEELLALVEPSRLLTLLRRRLEASGFFGARFRETAGRALLLPRGAPRHRVPLWLNRQRSKRLLDAIARYPDFPLLLETWRTCLQDELDIDTLRVLLEEVERGEIEVVEVTTARASPFAGGLGWKQTNRLMYEDDASESGLPTRLGGDLIGEVALSASLRPRLSRELTEELRRKLQRTWPGYAPPADELADWVRERVAVPFGEWRELLAAVARDHALADDALAHELAPVRARLIALLPHEAPEAGEPLVLARELLPRWMTALDLGDEEVALAPLDPAGLPSGELSPPEAAELLAGARAAAPVNVEGAEALLEELLAEWLRFHGPVPFATLGAALGSAGERLRPALDALADAERVVVDRLLASDEAIYACDAENLARLLRMLRAAARPQLVAQPLSRLPLFLAVQQGIAPRREGIDGLQGALERLFGWSAPAGLWESELLPARLDPYQPSWLDTLLQETELVWVGTGRERVTFAFPEELPLLGDRAGQPDDDDGDEPVATTPAASEDGDDQNEAGSGPARRLFPGPGRFTLPELLQHGAGDSAALTRRLWTAAWAGEVTNDTFAAVRRGLLNRFRPAAPPVAGLHRPPGRRGFERWQATRAFTGRWYALAAEGAPPDPIAAAELDKERARLLLARYGVLFRELLLRELPALQWRQVFRALRLMELAGEVAAGAFFADVPGPQFASPAAVRRLRRELPEDAVWWISALDPASPCGLPLAAVRETELPRRAAGNHLVYRGSRLALVSESRGRRLRFQVPPDDPGLADLLEIFRVQLTRTFAPQKSVEVAEINGEPAAESPYAPALLARFQVTSTAGGLRLWRRY
jgi:ATP-dependent Lhr-like helicase